MAGAPVVSVEILRAAAVEWLRYEKSAKLVCLERSPFPRDPCVPDVMGITQSRYAIEVEIKRTIQDLRNNRKKTSMFQREFLNIAPSKFYFLVPVQLVTKVLPLLEPQEGLLTLAGRSPYSGLPRVSVYREAATNRKARRLSIGAVIKMAAHQTGTLCSALVKIAKAFDDNPLEEGDLEAEPENSAK